MTKTLVIATAVVALGMASPAFAQCGGCGGAKKDSESKKEASTYVGFCGKEKKGEDK